MSSEEIVPMVPLSSLMLHCKPQRAIRKVKDRGRVGEKILPSCLSPSWLGICLALLCVPSTTCLLSLAEEPGGRVSVLHWFLLPGGGRGVCLKGTIPDRRLLLYKPPHLWLHSTASIMEVIGMTFYPMWSKLISYLCRHQRGYENQAFVAKIQLNKMGPECWIQQFNLGNQWDELAPGNSNKIIFVVFLFGDLEYKEVSHIDVPGVSMVSVFAVGVWEACTSGKSSSDTIYPSGSRDCSLIQFNFEFTSAFHLGQTSPLPLCFQSPPHKLEVVTWINKVIVFLDWRKKLAHPTCSG